MDLAWIILKQAILMLLLNVVGIIAYRTKVVDKNGGRQFSNFVLEIVTPVLVVNAYADVEYESRLVVNMLWTFLLAAVSYVVFIAAVYLLVRQKPGRETEIERFSAIYSNCGFMGIPLASAILGNEGVFYTTAFLSVFFCFAWTHGIMLLTGQHDRKALVKKLCSPTMIGIVIGLLLFFFRIPLPALLGQTFGYVAGLNTPMAMYQRGTGRSVPRPEESAGVLCQCREAADRAGDSGGTVSAAGLHSGVCPYCGAGADGSPLGGNVHAPVPETRYERCLRFPHLRRHHAGVHADHACGGEAVYMGVGVGVKYSFYSCFKFHRRNPSVKPAACQLSTRHALRVPFQGSLGTNKPPLKREGDQRSWWRDFSVKCNF